MCLRFPCEKGQSGQTVITVALNGQSSDDLIFDVFARPPRYFFLSPRRSESFY